MVKHTSFMPTYGNFENQPLSRKPLPIEQSAKAHGPLVSSIALFFLNFCFLHSFLPFLPFTFLSFKNKSIV